MPLEAADVGLASLPAAAASPPALGYVAGRESAHDGPCLEKAASITLIRIGNGIVSVRRRTARACASRWRERRRFDMIKGTVFFVDLGMILFYLIGIFIRYVVRNFFI